MARFIDKNGYFLSIFMIDHDTKCSLEDEFFGVNELKMNDNHRYIVDDVMLLAKQARECWACTGEFADGGQSNTFHLYYRIMDENGDDYKLFDSDFIADMAEEYDVPYSACI